MDLIRNQILTLFFKYLAKYSASSQENYFLYVYENAIQAAQRLSAKKLSSKRVYISAIYVRGEDLSLLPFAAG